MVIHAFAKSRSQALKGSPGALRGLPPAIEVVPEADVLPSTEVLSIIDPPGVLEQPRVIEPRPATKDDGLWALRSSSLGILLLLVFVSWLPAGCVSDGSDDVLQAGPIDRPFFAVSDVFTPSGHMGDGQVAGFVTMFVDENCKERPLKLKADGTSSTFGSCYNFDYEAGNINWAGAYWVYPSNNWGTERGRLFKPWTVSGTDVYQRYNTLQFNAAVNRNSLELSLSTVGADNTQYRINGIVDISGPSQHSVQTSLYFLAPDLKAFLKLEPGNYAASVAAGWQLEALGEDGEWLPVEGAGLLENPVPFSLVDGVDVQATFQVQLGSEVIEFPIVTPEIVIDFFAGAVKEDRLVGLLCPDLGEQCPHRDAVTTSELQKKQRLTRTWQTINLDITLRPPCVANVDGERPSSERDADGNRTGRILCPAGTVTDTGLIATCGQTASGTVTEDGSVLCCLTGNATRAADDQPWMCNGDSRPGDWMHWDEITETLIGAFGWATNYQTFQRAEEAALRAQGIDPEPPDEGGVATLDPALLPKTNVYIDNIVWQFLPTP